MGRYNIIYPAQSICLSFNYIYSDINDYFLRTVLECFKQWKCKQEKIKSEVYKNLSC